MGQAKQKQVHVIIFILFSLLCVVHRSILLYQVADVVLESVEFGLGASGYGLHIGHELAQLRDGDADTAARRVVEHRLAALHAAELKEKYEGGEVAVGERRSLAKAHRVWYLVDEVAVDHQVLGPRTKARQAYDALADLALIRF